MNILIAPDKFKGSLTALQVCDAIEVGIRRIFPDATIQKVPMADGGDGTVQALVDATGGEFIFEDVTGPLGEPVRARYGMLGDGETAVIEMADASGYHLVPSEKRNPLITTTFGTGELIRAARRRGAKKLIIGIGGSATNDGGAGCAQALGAKFLDANGRELEWGGGALNRLERIDVTSLVTRRSPLDVIVACDVDNPLTGDRGASAIFGPQKGATPEMIKQLDAALARYAEVIRRDLGKDIENVPGSGAAGGLGAGLMAFLDAKLQRGVEIVIDAVKLRQRMNIVQLVITGEGRLDRQTAYWKVPMGVAQAAKERGLPVIAIVGGVGEGWDAAYEIGIDAVIPIVNEPDLTLEEAKQKAPSLLASAAEAAMRIMRIGETVKHET